MLIQPDTYIRLIRDCPLDNRYEHTVYFKDLAEQEAYFKSFSGAMFTKNSYQRYSAGVLTVQAKIENIYNCNYLMFRNEAFENKWFYAFVTRIEYVNNVTCRVYYDLDVMQTWFFDYELGDCFVEREHSVTDLIGENLVHEDIYFGPYMYGRTSKPVHENGFTMQQLSIVIMYNPALLDLTSLVLESEMFYERNYYGGVYQGVNFFALPASEETVELLHTFITAIDFTTFGGFLSAFIMPTIFLPPERSKYNEYNASVYFELPRNTDFDGYVPKNKKLFTYPYTCANLTANRNAGNDFAFEYFEAVNGEPVGNTAAFIATGNLSANPSCMAYPILYKNVGLYTEGGVTIPSFPICTWGADGVTEWINNNLFKSLATVGTMAAIGSVSPAVALGGATASSAIPGQLALGGAPIAGALGGAPVAGLLNPGTNPFPKINFGNMFDTFSETLNSALNTPSGTLTAVGMARSEFDPGSVHGNVDGDVLMGIPSAREFTARVKHITAHYAKIVDDYFSRFGYATMLIKQPNRNGRKHWNYVKTRGCSIKGHIPADDISKIGSIYDRGITFWNKKSTVGDYLTQDNSV